MASVSFHLKRPDSDVPTPIFILFNADGKRHKLYTGINVLPQHWDREEQRAKTGKGYPKVNSYTNQALELMRENLIEYHAKQRAKGIIPSSNELKAVIEPVKLEEEQEAAQPAFIACYEEWVKVCEVTKRPNTIKTYRTTLRHLREFERYARITLTFDSINAAFGHQFPAYLIKKRDLKDNVVKKNINILKAFMGYATDHGLTENYTYKKYTWTDFVPEIITLNKEEVEAIVALDLSSKPYLENARALFLLACYTGLRYSDVNALRPEHVYDKALQLTTIKKGDNLRIPLRKEAREIIGLLTENKVHQIENQPLNRYVKEIAQLAGIDRPVEKISTQGGKRLSGVVKPKYKWITFHVGRKTFTTQALKDRMRPETVRKITGHKSLQAFNRYVEVAQRDVDEEFAAVYGD